MARPDAIPDRFYPYHFLSMDLLSPTFNFNEKGVAVRHKSDQRSYINPLYAAYQGLVVLNSADASTVESIADHLIEISSIDSNTAMLFYTIDHAPFYCRAPWASGITQGLAASFFIRLFVATGKVQYSEFAKNCIRGMYVPAGENGTYRKSPEGLPWIEEYPGSEPSYVLNGFLFSIIGQLEVEVITGERFNISSAQLINSFMQSYNYYKAGRYLKYDRLRGKFCSPQYMGLHILLFYHLFRLTGIGSFKQLSQDLIPYTHWKLYFSSFGGMINPEAKLWIASSFDIA